MGSREGGVQRAEAGKAGKAEGGAGGAAGGAPAPASSQAPAARESVQAARALLQEEPVTLQKVRGMFLHAWRAYRAHAWGKDNLRPVSQSASDEFLHMSATLVDGLTTMAVMGLEAELREAIEWVATPGNLDLTQQENINLFESTIRVLGSMLSTYELTGRAHGVLVQRAVELADGLSVAFDTPSGVPHGTVGLRSRRHYNPAWQASEASHVAEVATLQLEWETLSRVTGDPRYAALTRRAMHHVLKNAPATGLFPMYMDVRSGRFQGGTITLGARSDSVYEYLLKQWILAGGLRGDASTHQGDSLMFNPAMLASPLAPHAPLAGIPVSLRFTTSEPLPALRAASGEGAEADAAPPPPPPPPPPYAPPVPPLDASRHQQHPPMNPQDVGSGMPPLTDAEREEMMSRQEEGLASGGLQRDTAVLEQGSFEYERAWFQGLRQQYDASVAGIAELLVEHTSQSHLTYIAERSTADRHGGTNTGKMDHLVCFAAGMLALGARGDTRARDLQLAKELAATCHEMYARTRARLAPEIVRFTKEDMVVDQGAKHCLLRPEAVEAWFVLFRVTGDPIYRQWGRELIEALEAAARVGAGGYASLEDVWAGDRKRDMMESFFLAETMKYLYLLFADGDHISLDHWVFNTEAHPLPIFPAPDPVPIRAKKL